MTTTLASKGPGLYESTDGRVRILLDPTFITECDNEHSHPVRMRVDRMKDVYSDRGIEEMKRRGKLTSKWSKSEGRYVEYLSYQCEGGEEHFYSQWTVEVDGDWTDDVYETFADARYAAEKIVGPTKLSRPRKPVESAEQPESVEPETTTDQATGIRLWSQCGHHAEYDINGACYVCHLPV